MSGYFFTSGALDTMRRTLREMFRYIGRERLAQARKARENLEAGRVWSDYQQGARAALRNVARTIADDAEAAGIIQRRRMRP